MALYWGLAKLSKRSNGCTNVASCGLFYFFGKGRRIILVYGIRNKGTGIPKKDLIVAQKRRKDWERRNPL